MHYPILFVRALLLGACTVILARGAEPPKRSYDLPAADAATAIRRFSEVSGREVLYAAAIVRGIQTNAVRGEFTAREALDRMLAGTPLRVVQDNATQAFAVVRAGPEPPPAPPPHPQASSVQKSMTNRNHILPLLTALFVSGGTLGSGQTAGDLPSSAASASAAGSTTVVLPKFEVSEDTANPYQSSQALSASRVAMNVQDIPQTVSVVTHELIEDTGATRMLDAAKYVTPIVESTLPYGGDRYMIRGFQVSEEFIDGTNISGADGYSASLAPYNIERIEIIKGPNAILVPGGSPGGVMNPITKSPLNVDMTFLSLGISEYLGNDFWFDVNRVLAADGKMAVRLVGAVWKTNYYINGQFRNGYEASPSFSYQFSSTEKLTLKADLMQDRETNLSGLPVDPSIGSNGYAQIARGLPRDFMFGNDTDARHRTTVRGSAELLSTFGDHVTSRLYLMGDEIRRFDVGGTGAGLTNAGGGSVNPFTGQYEPGVSWNTAAYNANPGVTLVGTPAPVTDPSTWIYTRNNGYVQLHYTEAHIKNDYVIEFGNSLFKSTTLAGFAANTSTVHYRSYPAASRPPVAADNLAGITFPAYVFPPILPGLTTAALGTDKTARQDDLQMFAQETLSVLNDHLLVSGGVSRFFGEVYRTDNTGTAILASLPTSPPYNLTSDATSVGVVLKPVKPVSLFFSRNTTGGTLPGTLSAGITDPTAKLAVGDQNEYGVKTSLLDGRLTSSFSYFDIKQKNYPITDSVFYTLQSEGLFAEAALHTLPLYVDLESKGWEFEATYSFNKNLTILGNYTNYRERVPVTNVRLRAVPDHAGGLFADYQFTTGVLRGFGMNIGVDYKSDVAGTNASGYTTTRPLPSGPAFVPVQPTFLVAGRTLADVGFTYKYNQRWTVRLTIDNAFNKSYIMAAGSGTSLVAGTPRSWQSELTYKF